jgi:hypothetical protein
VFLVVICLLDVTLNSFFYNYSLVNLHAINSSEICCTSPCRILAKTGTC